MTRSRRGPGESGAAFTDVIAAIDLAIRRDPRRA